MAAAATVTKVTKTELAGVKQCKKNTFSMVGDAIFQASPPAKSANSDVCKRLM